jgi:segregation and condensation protein B
MEAEDAFRLCTNAEYSEEVRRLLQKPLRKPLTQPLLETLSIIAYKQPVTKGVIEEIRGVNADHAVNKLLEYGLIIEKGRLEAPGRPILFGTSEDFLRVYGLTRVEELFALAGESMQEMEPLQVIQPDEPTDEDEFPLEDEPMNEAELPQKDEPLNEAEPPQKDEPPYQAEPSQENEPL